MANKSHSLTSASSINNINVDQKTIYPASSQNHLLVSLSPLLFSRLETWYMYILIGTNL